MCWALPNDVILRGDREVSVVWGDSDSVATRPRAHPTEQSDVHDCFFRARLSQLLRKPQVQSILEAKRPWEGLLLD